MYLTTRERDIMKLASIGMGDKEIADRLEISARTVNTHLTRIYNKNAVKNRAEASAMFLASLFKSDN